MIKYTFDFEALKKDIPTMVRFLDDVIDVNNFPLPEIEEATKKTRKIGLGVMGWADTLIKLGIPYDSKEAIELAEQIMKTIQETAIKVSNNIAVEKSEEGKTRNLTRLCIAPTGTISRIAGVSSGIEPIFAWETHHKLVDLEYDEIHWAVTENKDLLDRLGEYPDYMRTAKDISPEWHIKHQATWQKYIDNSVSKTVNMPFEATVEDVKNAYLKAYYMRCKGITIYRDDSRVDQPLNDMSKVANPVESTPKIDTLYRSRGPIAIGATHKVETPTGKIYITVNYDREQQEPVECFIRLGNTATPKEMELAEWTGRLISLCLKYNVPISHIQRQSEKVFGGTTFLYDQKFFSSLPQLVSHLIGVDFDESLEKIGLEDALSNKVEWEPDFVIDSVWEEEKDLKYEIVCSENSNNGEYCYKCGTYSVIRQGGCKVCTNCGDDKCGG